ncbi:MAG TPA: PKD domain-containing protein, partial [Thermoplasmata archaeon]|nr:PKD domain-containing protein [Thermoplasmata archaeon]
TWAFSGGSWRPVSTGAASPPGLVAGMMDYDPDLGGVVLTGGVTGGEGVVNGSYEFNGTGWAALSADGAPWAASSGVGAWDPVDHEFVLAGGNETENRTFVLVDPVEITSVAGPRTVDVAENATFVPVLSGGPRPVRYAWTFDGAASATTPNASARFSSVGNRSVGLTVTAPGLPPVHWNGSVLVVPSPSEIVTSEGPATDVGVPDSFGATPVGGLAPFQFAWDFGDGGIANGTTAAHAWDEPGFYVVRARVTDAAGEASLNGVDVEVNATPSAAIAVGGYTFQPAEVGVPEPLLLGVTGGTPPFAANWSIGTVPLATGLSPAVRFPSPGNVVVTAFVGDAVGVNCSSTAPVNVAPAVTVSIAGPTTAPGGGGTWTAEVVGGVAPYQVRWSAPGNPVRTGDSAMLSFGSAGTYPVRVEVLDRAGGEASASTNVTVPASGSVGWGSLVGNLPVDLGVAAVGVAALVVLLAVRRRPASRRPEKFPRR